jgi:hypothetical protein
MPARSIHTAADVAFAEQEIVVLDQPRPGRGHEVGLIEHGCCLAARVSHEPTLRMRGEFAASEQPERCRVVLEQSPPATVESPNGGDLRRHAIELAAEVGEDVRRDTLHRIERGAGHLEKADLQRECHLVHGAPAFPDLDKLLLVEGEEVLNLQS